MTSENSLRANSARRRKRRNESAEEWKFNISKILLKLFIENFKVPFNKCSEMITRIRSGLAVLEEEKGETNWLKESKFNVSKILLKLIIDIFRISSKDCSEMITRICSEIAVPETAIGCHSS